MICWKLLNSFESRETSWKVGQASCSCNCNCKWQASSRRADISFNDDNALHWPNVHSFAKGFIPSINGISYISTYLPSLLLCLYLGPFYYWTIFWALKYDLLILGYEQLRKRVYYMMILHLQLAIYTVLQKISYNQ